MRFKLDRSFYIPKDAKVLAQKDDAIVYGYTDNKISGIAFKGRAQKPAWHCIFRTVEARQEYIDRWFKQLEQLEQAKTLYKQARQDEVKQASIKPGDYFYTSWGYDQTNIDYLVVIRVTAKTAVCKMVVPIHVGESCQSDVLMPGTACGDTFRMKISGKDSLVGSYPFCGDDSKRLDTFSRTKLGNTHNQTMAMFGH